NRHRGEVPRLVHLSGEGDHGGCQPRGVEGDGSEREMAEEVVKEHNLCPSVSDTENKTISHIIPNCIFCDETRHQLLTAVKVSCFTLLRVVGPPFALDAVKFFDFPSGNGDLSGFRLAVRHSLSDLNRLAALLLGELIPDAPTTGTNEQSQLAVARLAPQELPHRVWVFARQPLRLGHRSPSSLRPRRERSVAGCVPSRFSVAERSRSPAAAAGETLNLEKP